MAPRKFLPQFRARLWRIDQGIVLLGAALAVVGCVVGLLVIWNAHDTIVRHELERSESVARLLEDHASQTIKGADAVVRGLAQQMSQTGTTGPQDVLRARLGQSIRALPFLKSVSILDAHGRVLVSTERANQGLQLEVSQYRSYLGDESGRAWMGPVRAGRDLFEGGERRPQAVTAGQRHVTLSVPLDHAPGAEAAYLLATLHGDHFARFQDSLLPAWGREAALLQHAGKTLAATWGGDWVDGRWGQHGEELETAQARVRRGLAGGQAFVAQRRMADWPLDLWVELDYERGMAPWRETVRIVFFAELAYIILLLCLGLLAKRLLEGHRQTSQALAQSQAQMSGLVSRADLEAQLRARAQLEAQRAGELLAHMSHELRTPLTGVMGVLDLIESEPLSAKGRQLLGVARESSSMLLRHINHLLDLTKAEGGHVEIVRKDVNLRRCLQADVDSLRGTVRSPSVAMRLEWAPDTPDGWHVDEYRVRQIVLNLLGNAVKFTDQGEIVLQVCRWSGDGRVAPGLSLQVRDTGTGIALQDQERIFDRFAQARTVDRDRPLGTGLGLAICRTMAELQGGRIELVSAPGEGSRFTLRLPALQAAAPQPVPMPAPVRSVPGQAFRRLKVLVVDDVPANCLVLAEYLDQEGHDSVCVGDGRQALDTLRQESFDLVLLDDRMPGLAGHELVRHVRQLGRHSRTPSTVHIVGVSANVMPHERERFLAAGADHFLAKPVEQATLRELLAQLSTGGGLSSRWGALEGGGPVAGPVAAPLRGAEASVRASLARPEAGASDEAGQAVLGAAVPQAGERPSRLATGSPLSQPEAGRPVPPPPNPQPRIQQRVRELLREGLPKMSDRLAACMHDAPALRELAHQLKGSLAYAGWPERSDRARQAELAALQGDAPVASRLLTQLVQELLTDAGTPAEPVVG